MMEYISIYQYQLSVIIVQVYIVGQGRLNHPPILAQLFSTYSLMQNQTNRTTAQNAQIERLASIAASNPITHGSEMHAEPQNVVEPYKNPLCEKVGIMYPFDGKLDQIFPKHFDNEPFKDIPSESSLSSDLFEIYDSGPTLDDFMYATKNMYERYGSIPAHLIEREEQRVKKQLSARKEQRQRRQLAEANQKLRQQKLRLQREAEPEVQNNECDIVMHIIMSTIEWRERPMEVIQWIRTIGAIQRRD